MKPLVPISNVTVDPSDAAMVRAHIEADGNIDKHDADLYLAIAWNHAESQALRGENGGKHLVHVAVVERFNKIGKLPKAKSFAQDFQVKLKPNEDLKNLRLVVFAPEPGRGALLGASMPRSEPITVGLPHSKRRKERDV